MPRAELVSLEPSVLRWAIRESGLSEDEVAQRIKVSTEILRSWLAGDSKPSLTQFRKLASVLRRPAAALLLPEPPQQPQPEVEFRHPPESRSSLNPHELESIRRAARFQRMLSWLERQLGQEPLDLPEYRISDSPARAAIDMRKRLRVTVQEQLSWASETEAAEVWRQGVEAAGIYVFLLPLGEKGCRGYSLWDSHAPVIAVNTAYAKPARIFTLFHELGHLLTRTSSACVEVRSKFRSSQEDPVERWCERMAASLLMPKPAMDKLLSDRFHWSGEPISTLEPVKYLANKLKVSLRAAAIRLIEEDIASWELYSQIPPLSDHKTPGGPPGEGRRRWEKVLGEYGGLTARTFAAAVDSQVIDHSQAVEFLDVPDRDMEWLRGGAVGRGA